jgi:hypothetical protein
MAALRSALLRIQRDPAMQVLAVSGITAAKESGSQR